ncbi:MAG: Sec-independent protein translocase subunit TatA/TatB [Bdellovibrionota bacterium]|jgi:TatA/E family protein of Tat protein translocase
MFGISFSELIVIFLIILIVFGPDKLPQIANSMGKALREFNRKTNEIKDELKKAIEIEAPLKNTFDDQELITVDKDESGDVIK